MKYCSVELLYASQGIFGNYIKLVASDTPSPLKYGIIIGDIREVLFRPFRAREMCR